MIKVSLLIVLLVTAHTGSAQNIFSALHLNENRDYKTARPKTIIETNIFHGPSGETQQRHIKSFDDAGMLVSVQHFDKDNKLSGKATYINDTVHRIVLSSAHERKDRYSVTKSTTEYFYDSSHFLVRIRNKNAFGIATMTTSIVNNEKGLPVEMTVTDQAGQPFGKETASYDYNRNLAFTAVYSNDGRKLSGDSIKISFNNAFQFPDNTTQFNEQGDMIASQSSNLNGTVTNYEYEYKYDQFGNCLEQKIYKVTARPNGKKKKEVDRIFKKEYFY